MQALLRDSIPLVFIVFHIFISLVPQPSLFIVLLQLLFSLSYFLRIILGIISMLFNDKHRALHDFLAGTVVIRYNFEQILKEDTEENKPQRTDK